ncbi:hypothetical protein LCGC14_2153430 [marine sediment metagenome]|uniref:Uncharacterized protein n=1 Tax=marine sediment metagenome TaxID=412755 RepID=A0A0F9DUS5_9ZZZZ
MHEKYYQVGSYLPDSNYNMNLFVQASDKREALRIFRRAMTTSEYVSDLAWYNPDVRLRVSRPERITEKELTDEWDLTAEDFEILATRGYIDAGSGT